MSGYRKHFVPADDRKEHDRQPKEPDKAWKAFLLYRDMGFGRTIKKAAIEYRKLTGNTESKAESTERNMQDWSIRWGWVRRSESWERELDKQRQKLQIDDVKRMRERHVQLSMSMQQLGAIELKKMLKDVQDKATDGILTVSDIRHLVEAGVKLERMSRGEPDSIVEKREELKSDAVRQELKELVMDPETRDELRNVARKLIKAK